MSRIREIAVEPKQAQPPAQSIGTHINSLVQNYSKYSALEMELLQSCAEPSICSRLPTAPFNSYTNPIYIAPVAEKRFIQYPEKDSEIV